MYRYLKKLTFIILTGFGLWLLCGYIAARYLTSGHRSSATITATDLPVENIELISADHIRLSAWLLRGTSAKAIIILSGIGSDRSASLSRARLYREKGFTVMLPDLRATGKSSGNTVSFGWHERNDLKACYDFLKSSGYKDISAHGCSLGAATIVYALQEISDYHFIVLESCYDRLDHAFRNRVRKYHLPYMVYAPVEFFVESETGMETDLLNPAEFINRASCPLLIMAGDSETQLKLSETAALYNNCISTHKYLHIFNKGKHEDFLEKYPVEYKKTLNEFLAKEPIW